MTNSMAPAGEAPGRRCPGRESTTGAVLRERSRRATVTSVVDRIAETGGRFAERRADGSGWSVTIPAGRSRCEFPAR
uniref:hypothetical protein n=1 Tax=Amycolatopsis sp. CA-096443 TaxID=3239919 RepID=UPI003F49137F